MSNTRIKLLRDAPVSKALMSLGIPAILAMLIGALYNIVDTFFIGMLGDTASLGAATVLFPVFMLIGAVGLAFGIGAASSISRKLGEKREEEASRVGSTALFTTLIIAVAGAVSGVFFIEPLLKFFGATPTILDKAVIYGSIIIAGSPFQMLNMCMNNMIRAEGAAKTSGIAIGMGAILNILLDPIFMFVFDFGLAGAAIATIISQGTSTVFLLLFYILRRSHLHLTPNRITPTLKVYSEIMAIGVPTFLRQFLSSFAMAVLTNGAAPFGDSAIAAVGITMRIIMLPMMVLFGFGQGFQPLAGYAYGAANIPRVKKAVKYALGWTSKFSIAAALLLAVASKPLIGLFSQDPDVIQRGTLALRTVIISLPFLGFQLTYGFLFQALGRGKPTMILATARQGFIFLPLVLFLPRFFGISGLFAAQPAADILTLVLTAFLAFRQHRKFDDLEEIQRSEVLAAEGSHA